MAKTTPARIGLEIEDIAPGLRLQPGDDRVTLEDLRDRLLEELDPQTKYEQLMASNLVALELDAIRLRIMLDRLIVEAMFDVARDALTARLGAQFDSYGNALSPEGGEVPTELDAVNAKVTAMERRVWKAESGAVAMIETVLLEEGLDPVLVQAQARGRYALILERFETPLVATEQRRRRLMQDYRRLQASRPELVEVEDAEVFDDDDFGI